MQRVFVLLAAVGSLLLSAYALQAEDQPYTPQPTPAKAAEGELRRRAMFGAQLAPVTKDVRDRQKLDGDGGIVLEKVFAGTAAAEGQFQAGDVILAIGGVKVTGVPMFVERVAEARAGDVLTLDVVRDGRVIAIWGTSDWLSTRAQSSWIAEVVNRVQPGNGSLVALDAIDHFFFRAASPEESYQIFKPAKGAPAGEFNPIILETLRAWLDATVGHRSKIIR